MASLGSSPSRHSSSFPCPVVRGSSKMFGYALGHRDQDVGLEDGHPQSPPSDSESAPSSQRASPWASMATTPLSTPTTSVAHGDAPNDNPCGTRTIDKKRLSRFGSMPASYWTTHRAPAPSEGSSPPPTCPLRGKRQHSRNGSWSSSSSSSTPHSFCPKEHISNRDSKRRSILTEPSAEPDTASLVPNAQFLGLMLLMILLISSPLIKILSVLLFVAVVVLEPSDSYF